MGSQYSMINFHGPIYSYLYLADKRIYVSLT